MSQIITLADLQSYMPTITLNGGQAQVAVDAVNQYIESQTHRCFGETVTVTERYDWGKTLWLRHADVTAVASITLGWPNQPQTALASSSYFFNPQGRITLYMQMFGRPNSFAQYNDYITVSYSYGVTDVPDDLKQAALGIAAGFYNWSINGNKDIVATSVGSYRVQFSGSVRQGPATPGASKPRDTIEVFFGVVKSYATQRV